MNADFILCANRAVNLISHFVIIMMGMIRNNVTAAQHKAPPITHNPNGKVLITQKTIPPKKHTMPDNPSARITA